jgi:hypothetical protein
MGFKTPTFHSTRSVCYFLLAQKVIPVGTPQRGNRKKGTLPNASSLNAYTPSLGKEASPLFSLI